MGCCLDHTRHSRRAVRLSQTHGRESESLPHDVQVQVQVQPGNQRPSQRVESVPQSQPAPKQSVKPAEMNANAKLQQSVIQQGRNTTQVQVQIQSGKQEPAKPQQSGQRALPQNVQQPGQRSLPQSLQRSSTPSQVQPPPPPPPPSPDLQDGAGEEADSDTMPNVSSRFIGVHRHQIDFISPRRAWAKQ